jgi:hypothetical protein
MQDPAKFKEYADECRRLMALATPDNRERLRVMAEAWDRCAEAATLAIDAAHIAGTKKNNPLDEGSSS